MSSIREQLSQELAPVDWGAIIPHAQRDAVIVVHPQLELLEVGVAIAANDTQTVQRWIAEALIRKPTARELSDWNQTPTREFTTLIVQPFVLIEGSSM